MKFTKMHGCGNDFVVTHDVAEEDIASVIDRTPFLCDRHKGIGADGVVLVLPSEVADLKMRIINADGGEAEMCGNGIRCAHVYAGAKGIGTREQLVFETGAGLITTAAAGERIKVNMGSPILEPARIPVAGGDGVVKMKRLEANGRQFAVTAVSMGNPHAVVYAEELSDELVLGFGPALESHAFFPRRANVEFVKVLGPDEIDMRVFERGVGETLACGTGACAAAVAGILNGKHGIAVTVHLTGGDLLVEWDGDAAHPVFMTGPVERVYEGSIAVDTIRQHHS